VDHKPQVRSDHSILRVQIAALDALGELDLLCGREQRILGSLLEEELQRLEVAGQLLLLRLGGRVVQTLDLSALRLAGLRLPPESVLLLSVAVRLYPFPSLISGSFMRHESHKALLMVRPVERAVVTRAPLLCHNSQNCGALASNRTTSSRGHADQPSLEWLLRSQHVTDFAG
jgi:hypothetical protein